MSFWESVLLGTLGMILFLACCWNAGYYFTRGKHQAERENAQRESYRGPS